MHFSTLRILLSHVLKWSICAGDMGDRPVFGALKDAALEGVN